MSDLTILKVGHRIFVGGVIQKTGVIVFINGALQGEPEKIFIGGLGVYKSPVKELKNQATLTIAFENSHILNCKECVLYLLKCHLLSDSVLSQPEIDAIVASANRAESKAIREKEKEKIDFKSEVQKLSCDSNYKHLSQDKSDRNYVQKNIRNHLKKLFPSVKFSVRKDSHNSVTITYCDGHSLKEVETALELFRAGYFCGHQDMYIRERTPFAALFGSFEYISVNRDYTDDFLIKSFNYINTHLTKEQFYHFQPCEITLENYKARKLHHFSIPSCYLIDKVLDRLSESQVGL